MNVQLKLFATLRRYLPDGAVGNRCQVEAPKDTRVRDLLARFGVPEKESLVILVNGRDAPADCVLQEGDVVAVFPAMAGG
jgi:sulfur carrier protein ThiS